MRQDGRRSVAFSRSEDTHTHTQRERRMHLEGSGTLSITHTRGEGQPPKIDRTIATFLQKLIGQLQLILMTSQ
jgi:hypothetical protein